MTRESFIDGCRRKLNWGPVNRRHSECGQVAVASNKEGRFAAALFIPFLLPLPLLDQAALAALFLSAQRFFIISEMRLFAAALRRRRPRLPLPTAARPRRPLMEPRRADIACSRRSLSDSNSEMICCVSI